MVLPAFFHRVLICVPVRRLVGKSWFGLDLLNIVNTPKDLLIVAVAASTDVSLPPRNITDCVSCNM